MPKFGKRSTQNKKTLVQKLQDVLDIVILKMDISVICGTRGKEDQNKAYDEGKSTLRYPQSNHNKSPSSAVDVVPYPSLWSDVGKFYRLAAHMFRAANDVGIKLRGGLDWNRNGDLADQKFNDLPHFEEKGKATDDEIIQQEKLSKAYDKAAERWESNH